MPLLKYPDMGHVQTANRLKLAMWCRFLPSPGSAWIAKSPVVFDTEMAKESCILEAIRTRFNFLGGWSPAVSKKLGWDEPVDNQTKDA
jgi:hypothetical protein